MQVLISVAGRYNTFMLGVLALAMSALTIAACDSTIAPDTGATIDPGDELVLGKGHQVAVCHVGHKLPEYDPACTEGCGDAGKVDLIFVPQKVVGKHVGNPVHTYGDVSDYLPGDEGASGMGQEDTSDDGVYVDDGCVIPDEETVFAIAYVDADPADGDGFKDGVDVLIAKLVDANNDNVANAGDVIITDSYPLNSGATAFGSFGVTSHTLASVDVLNIPGAFVIVEALDAAGNRLAFIQAFFEGDVATEGYAENGGASFKVFDGVGPNPNDLRAVAFADPSQPDTEVPQILETPTPEEAFVDVDFTLP